MKLSPRDADGFFRRPDTSKAGVLIYGLDPMRIAIKRQQIIPALIGPNGEEEMRLTRMSGAELRKDPAMLLDALKAISFFPGPRVAFVEDANDQAAPAILAALEDWSEGDAHLIVTAGNLKPTSKIRKAFEAHKNAYAAAIYDNPPTREEIERALKDAGLTSLDRDAMEQLTGLAQEIEPGDFRQTLEKLTLYKRGDTTPVTFDDITACAPTSTEAALDDVLHIVAEARSDQIGPVLRKLQSQGVQPVGLCIGATRHFRTLHATAVNPNSLWIKGPKGDRLRRQSQAWGKAKLEQALEVLLDTDLQLRSAAQAPQMALMERALIRLAMLGRR
ncbi:DNA polymerase III subunit delta [Nereida sp. MMG025]|uniref:DNA polymerase III subunit delta n=1 Tax=Nereida sp. MMG025 TaxID=2909981 RepID=UPI001F1E0B20|nr:DNA polymerase III subunit delta [Nereida sp. MMG025]MCF6444776.1 DNA polymerase III subunit delta [Nereida sp. MMG025]